jgi:hypothetical protein
MHQIISHVKLEFSFIDYYGLKVCIESWLINKGLQKIRNKAFPARMALRQPVGAGK